MTDFQRYCQLMTDAQLEYVLAKEWSRHKHGDYKEAQTVAEFRGWTVVAGKRLA